MPDDPRTQRSAADEVTGKHRPIGMEPTGKYVAIDDSAADLTEKAPAPSGVTATFHSPPALTSGPPSIPGYDVVGELGRGGMGVVYKAWQVAAKRFVALKMVLAGAEATTEQRQRFRAEAEAVARLSHPNIIQVYEVGEHQGWAFFSLEFCGGGSLAKKLAGNPLSAQAAAVLVEKLARAVAAAHARHIVHRDLKPANILMADGEPKIGDFGLAKRLDSDDMNTRTGAVIGTPSYMPPEQASGTPQSIGPAADVYALGAILYECLTGRPPFKGATVMDTLDQVRHQEPVPPRLLEAKVPRDLDTICLKCLRKEPAQRYAGAQQLADDLRHFLDGRPIEARPVGAAERARKWMKRRPAVAALLAALALAVVGAAVGATLFTVRLDEKKRDAERAAEDARTARRAEEVEKADALLARNAALSARNAEAREKDKALAAEYVARLQNAEQAARAGNPARSLEILELCRWDRRGPEFYYLQNRLRPAAEPLLTVRHRSRGGPVAYSLDGSVLFACHYGDFIAWDAQTGAERFRKHVGQVASLRLAVHPAGRFVAVAGQKDLGEKANLEFRDAFTGQATKVFDTDRPLGTALAFSTDGRLLAAGGQKKDGSGHIHVFDVATATEVWRAELMKQPLDIAFAPEGGELAVAATGQFLVFDAATGKEKPAPNLGDGLVTAVAYSPDGTRLAVGGYRNNFDRLTGQPIGFLGLHRRDAQRPPEIRFTLPIRTLAYSPDGRTLAAGGGEPRVSSNLILFDAASGDPLGQQPAQRFPADVLAFRTDGSRLAVSSSYGVIHVWDMRDPLAELLLSGADQRLSAPLRFSVDGRFLLGFPSRAWDLRAGAPVDPAVTGMIHNAPAEPRQDKPASWSHRSPDGRWLARNPGRDEDGAFPSGKVEVFDVRADRLVATLTAPKGSLYAAGFSPDAAHFATLTRLFDNGFNSVSVDLTVWETATGARCWEATIAGGNSHVGHVGFNPDGRLIAAAAGERDRPGRVRVWSVADGVERYSLRNFAGNVTALAFSPDSQRLFTGSMEHDPAGGPASGTGEVKFWDAASGQELLTLAQARPPLALAVAGNNGDFAESDTAGQVRLHRMAGEWRAVPLRLLRPEIARVGFSADGQRIVAQIQPTEVGGFGRDKPIPPEFRAWVAVTGEELPAGAQTLTDTREAVSPDGRLVVKTDGYVLEVRRAADLTPEAQQRRKEADFWDTVKWHNLQLARAQKDNEAFAARFHAWRLLAQPASARPQHALALFAIDLCHGPPWFAFAEFAIGVTRR